METPQVPRLSDWNQHDVESVMSVASALTILTASPTLLAKVPEFISALVNSTSVTFAVIRLPAASPAPNSAMEFFHISVSEPNVNIEQARHTVAGALNTIDLKSPCDSVAASRVAFYRVMPEVRYGMLLELSPKQPIHEKKLAMLIASADMLSRLLAAMLSCIASPAVLGSPFDRLTEREWVVLQGLQSDEGEKQLADRLELSPHTLHSHIKSIYRKLGVQGRLPVLLMMENAQRTVELRQAKGMILNASKAL